MSEAKILIVEDELLIAQNVSRKLKKMGYHIVDIVSSGEVAVQTAVDKKPDLVLMDIVIQGAMDGIEAAAKIRELCDIPIIYLTAYADEKTLERAKLTDPLGYILKPFKDRELRVTVELALSRHLAEVAVRQALMQAEERCQEAAEQVERKTEQISMVSHEFRTPLSIIKITAELLQNYENQLTEETKKHHLQRIRTAANNMNQLLEGVLTFGKVECSKMEFFPLPIDIVRFCAELIEALQYSADTKHTIQFINDSQDHQVQVDEKVLWHILNNLLTNAVKYSPDGGIVTLSLTTTPTELCLQVQDQGIGISPEDQKRLFEPFQRATNVGKIPGTGLGLAIVKQLVDLHQGHIMVQSQVGQGTTFVLTLPRQFDQSSLNPNECVPSSV